MIVYPYMKILAIDFGTKTLGLAMTDTDLDIVFPFGTMANFEPKVFLNIKDLVLKEDFEKIVMGLPLGMNNEETEATKRVHEFATKLEAEVGMSIAFADERFSTHEANRMGGEVSADEKSAMIILETYLQKL